MAKPENLNPLLRAGTFATGMGLAVLAATGCGEGEEEKITNPTEGSGPNPEKTIAFEPSTTTGETLIPINSHTPEPTTESITGSTSVPTIEATLAPTIDSFPVEQVTPINGERPLKEGWRRANEVLYNLDTPEEGWWMSPEEDNLQACTIHIPDTEGVCISLKKEELYSTETYLEDYIERHQGITRFDYFVVGNLFTPVEDIKIAGKNAKGFNYSLRLESTQIAYRITEYHVLDNRNVWRFTISGSESSRLEDDPLIQEILSTFVLIPQS